MVSASIHFTIPTYTFFTHKSFHSLLEGFAEVEEMNSKLQTDNKASHSQFTGVILKYFLLLGLLGFHGFTLSHHGKFHVAHFLMRCFNTWILCHGMLVLLHSLEYIEASLTEALVEFRRIMDQYLALPSEEVVEVAEGNFLLRGWIKAVLEKRKDEKVAPLVALLTSLLSRLGESIDRVNDVHGAALLGFLVTLTAMFLESLNLIVACLVDEKTSDSLSIVLSHSLLTGFLWASVTLFKKSQNFY